MYGKRQGILQMASILSPWIVTITTIENFIKFIFGSEKSFFSLAVLGCGQKPAFIHSTKTPEMEGKRHDVDKCSRDKWL